MLTCADDSGLRRLSPLETVFIYDRDLINADDPIGLARLAGEVTAWEAAIAEMEAVTEARARTSAARSADSLLTR